MDLTSNKPRDNYINWDEYFISVALLSAKRSKDPVTQVGCCIVKLNNHIIGVGYNGMPNGCNDNEFPWGKFDTNPLNNKYMYVVHAEANAILNKYAADLSGCKLYTTMFPCNECTKLIIQSGIAEIIYLFECPSHKISTTASRRMLDAVGIKYWQFIPKIDNLTLDFRSCTNALEKLSINENEG